MELEDGFYASPRWSWEILDCAMPMTFDTYSNCAHQCVYCFAFFQRAIGGAADDYMAHRVKAVDVEKVKRLFMLDPDMIARPSYGQFAWYIKNRHVLQWGGLSDGFDWYERKFRKSLELLKFFVEINYPVSISTKGTWFVDDPEYRAVLKDAKNVHFKYSIITDDPKAAQKLEAGTAAPAERFRAMEELNKLGIGATTLRFRPFVIGVSEKSIDRMFERAKDIGAYSITTEFLCLEKRASANHLERYRRISEVVGFDVWTYYRKFSYSGSGLMRLNYDVKRPHIQHMEQKAAELGIPFYVSDAHHKEASAGGGCCGLPDHGPLSNYNKGQYSEAMQIAKKNGVVHWSDIAAAAEGLKNIPFGKAEGYNQGDTFTRAKRRYHTMFDFMHDVWNSPKSWQSPARYFGGALVPAETDANGDIVYLYNKPFVEQGIHVTSVRDLADRLTVQMQDMRADGGTAGHVAYPVFILSRGRADIAKTPALLDEARIPYTLVVEPHEEAAYADAFPHAERLVLRDSDRGIAYARQYLLDFARRETFACYWQLDDNLHGFFRCGDGKSQKVTARAALSALEGLADGYEHLALVAADYQQFAFRAKTLFSVNARAYACVLTRTDTGIDYRPPAEMKEDVDFTLQHLAAGWNTLLVHEWAMDKTPMGKNKKGGLVEKYRAGLHEDAARWIVAQWAAYAELKSKPGGVDALVHWKRFTHPLQVRALAEIIGAAN